MDCFASLLVAAPALQRPVDAGRVTARFGGLGELDYRFASKQNGSVDCNGAEEGEAGFEGTSTSPARTAMSTSKPTQCRRVLPDLPRAKELPAETTRTARWAVSPVLLRRRGNSAGEGRFARAPAPFTGSATFTRHGDDGHGTWKGSLGMPIGDTRVIWTVAKSLQQAVLFLPPESVFSLNLSQSLGVRSPGCRPRRWRPGPVRSRAEAGTR